MGFTPFSSELLLWRRLSIMIIHMITCDESPAAVTTLVASGRGWRLTKGHCPSLEDPPTALSPHSVTPLAEVKFAPAVGMHVHLCVRLCMQVREVYSYISLYTHIFIYIYTHTHTLKKPNNSMLTDTPQWRLTEVLWSMLDSKIQPFKTSRDRDSCGIFWEKHH